MGQGWLSKSDATQGRANSTRVPPNQKANKAKEPTYLIIKIATIPVSVILVILLPMQRLNAMTMLRRETNKGLIVAAQGYR
jgi:hypothetical protein